MSLNSSLNTVSKWERFFVWWPLTIGRQGDSRTVWLKWMERRHIGPLPYNCVAYPGNPEDYTGYWIYRVPPE